MTELETGKWRSPAGAGLLAGAVSMVVVAFTAQPLATATQAQGAGSRYPNMAAVDQYLMTQDAEIVLARSAAPDSISKDADVLVMDRHGYRTAINGRNGFVCLVLRSWTARLDDPDFWNPKLRGPICLNPPAARSYLPRIIKRTTLALAGKTRDQLPGEMKAAFDAKEIPAIEPGALGYMLSKHGYLGDSAKQWHPHIMFFVPPAEPAEWGANSSGSPILGQPDQTDRASVFVIPVRKWSDGSSDLMDTGSH